MFAFLKLTLENIGLEMIETEFELETSVYVHIVSGGEKTSCAKCTERLRFMKSLKV